MTLIFICLHTYGSFILISFKYISYIIKFILYTYITYMQELTIHATGATSLFLSPNYYEELCIFLIQVKINLLGKSKTVAAFSFYGLVLNS